MYWSEQSFTGLRSENGVHREDCQNISRTIFTFPAILCDIIPLLATKLSASVVFPVKIDDIK